MSLRQNTEREAIVSWAAGSAHKEACESGATVGREELESFIRRALDETVRISVRRKEPEFDPGVVHHMFSWRDRAYSVKITNLTVDMKRLFKGFFTDSFLVATGAGVDAGVGNALTGNFALAVPFFGILWTMRRLFTESAIPVTRQVLIVLGAMWTDCDENNEVERDGLLQKVNRRLVKFGEKRIQQKTLDKVLDELERLKAVEGVPSLRGKWKLRESVSATYTEADEESFF